MAEHTLNVNDSDFDEQVIKSTTPVLVDFWAPWCGPCLAVGPTLEDLAKEYQGKFKIVKMNVDENANIPAEFGVRSIPYMVFFKTGKVVNSLIGAHPKMKIKEMIDSCL